VETTTEIISDGAYLFPDRQWVRRKTKTFESELEAEKMPGRVWEEVQIGYEAYLREYDTDEEPGPWEVEARDQSPGGWFRREGSLLLDAHLLMNVERLPTEEINGIRCLRYEGKVDMDELFERSYPETAIEAMDPEEREALDKEREWFGLYDMTIELWIGKDDYLLPRFKYYGYNPYSSSSQLSNPSGSQYSITDTVIIEFHGYNEPIEIEPPV